MTESSHPAPPLPSWLKPGIWVRSKVSPYMGRAFVMFVDEGECKGGFRYHLAEPWKAHVRDQAWHTGGTIFAIGVKDWEPCESPLSERAEPEGYPGIAHDFEKMRSALQKLADCRVNDASGIFTSEFINARLDAVDALQNAAPQGREMQARPTGDSAVDSPATAAPVSETPKSGADPFTLRHNDDGTVMVTEKGLDIALAYGADTARRIIRALHSSYERN